MKRLAIGLLLAFVTFAQQLPDSDVLRLGPGITKPGLTHKKEPAYTKAARAAKVQGTVLLEVVIDRQGMPQNITVLNPLGFGLDENAIATVSQWRFKPALKDGNPVKVRATVEISYRLLGRPYDAKAEERRARFNAIVSHLAQSPGGKPSEKDVADMRDLAAQKSLAATYLLGIWQLNGEGMPKDTAAGLASIQKAAQGHYGPALFFIGNEQMKGGLLPKDAARGMSSIQDAALRGSREAQFTLGRIYAKGEGVEVDLNRAKTNFRLCAAVGKPECQFRLGQLLIDSPQRTESEWLQGIALLELAAGHNFAAAKPLADAEVAKLSPEQLNWMNALQGQLERKP